MADRIEQLLRSGELTAAVPLKYPLRLHKVTGVMTASEAIKVDRGEVPDEGESRPSTVQKPAD